MYTPSAKDEKRYRFEHPRQEYARLDARKSTRESRPSSWLARHYLNLLKTGPR
jgi:hypothetical protein